MSAHGYDDYNGSRVGEEFEMEEQMMPDLNWHFYDYLMQREFWKSGDGRELRLQDMEAAHVDNTLSWLRSHGRQIQEQYFTRARAALKKLPKSDYRDLIEYDLASEASRPFLGWINDLPIVKGLEAVKQTAYDNSHTWRQQPMWANRMQEIRHKARDLYALTGRTDRDYDEWLKVIEKAAIDVLKIVHTTQQERAPRLARERGAQSLADVTHAFLGNRYPGGF